MKQALKKVVDLEAKKRVASTYKPEIMEELVTVAEAAVKNAKNANKALKEEGGYEETNDKLEALQKRIITVRKSEREAKAVLGHINRLKLS